MRGLDRWWEWEGVMPRRVALCLIVDIWWRCGCVGGWGVVRVAGCSRWGSVVRVQRKTSHRADLVAGGARVSRR